MARSTPEKFTHVKYAHIQWQCCKARSAGSLKGLLADVWVSQSCTPLQHFQLAPLAILLKPNCLLSANLTQKSKMHMCMSTHTQCGPGNQQNQPHHNTACHGNQLQLTTGWAHVAMYLPLTMTCSGHHLPRPPVWPAQPLLLPFHSMLLAQDILDYLQFLITLLCIKGLKYINYTQLAYTYERGMHVQAVSMYICMTHCKYCLSLLSIAWHKRKCMCVRMCVPACVCVCHILCGVQVWALAHTVVCIGCPTHN